MITDPPFMKLDLISCRNMLIYIEPETQKKILSLFAFALNPDAYLFLGKSDTTGEQIDLFEPVSRSLRIFRRRPSVAVPFANFQARSAVPVVPLIRLDRRSPEKLSELNQQVLLRHFGASIVLIDVNGDILHFSGSSHKYLRHPFGDANLNLFEMIDPLHSLKLRLAIQKAARDKAPVKLEALEFSRDGAAVSAEVSVVPVVEAKIGQNLLAIILEDAHAPAKVSRAEGVEFTQRDDLTAPLEAEIARLKGERQTIVDGFQTTREELTAAKEEVLAINEELQSTIEPSTRPSEFRRRIPRII